MPEIWLPTFHAGQAAADSARTRFYALRCGRRWGKTEYLKTLAADAAAKGKNVFWGTPDYKIQAEAFTEVAEILDPIKKASSKTEGVIRTMTGGRIDFWSLENERAGRSRKYHLAIIDEGAFTKPNMLSIWERAIRPSLLDFRGSCVVASTPNGINDENFFYLICNQPDYGFTQYHAPTHTNPYLPDAEIAELKAKNHPLVYEQEYEAKFVDWSGIQFFDLANCLIDGQPVAYPQYSEVVFATIDTAVKTGRDNDATAVCYWAKSSLTGHPLVLLDWEVIQIEGSLLETWLPTVFQGLEILAKQCGARFGSGGAWIEDKASGSILLQQAQRRGWPAQAIESKLTALGKDERAISVSGYVHRGMVKLSDYAYNKITVFKGQSGNHFMKQFFGYRIGVKDQADDALDAGCYGISIALGNADGY